MGTSAGVGCGAMGAVVRVFEVGVCALKHVVTLRRRNLHPDAASGSVVGSTSVSYGSGGAGGKAARGGATEFCHAALRNVACNKGASCRCDCSDACFA